MCELTLGRALEVAMEARNNGIGAAVATVIANRGETALELSARMVVLQDGSTFGSLNGALDREVAARAMDCLSRKRSRVQSFVIDGSEASFVGTQGGEVDVFIEIMATPPHLIVAGAGHIAVPLARIGKLLGFRVTVLDDRASYANRERFPEADELIVGAYRQMLQGMTIDNDTYIVLVTRGHVHDSACLDEVLDRGAAYVGMIGSKRRVRTVLEHVGKTESSAGQLARVYAPVGLDIGAQTPEEIALAVMAEIVKVRRGGTGQSLALRESARV
jgi:xanthine dehydrogenase accessory factor